MFYILSPYSNICVVIFSYKFQFMYHRVPQSGETRDKWISFISNTSGPEEQEIAKQSRLCSLHFTPGCFVNGHGGKRRLQFNAVPSTKVPVSLDVHVNSTFYYTPCGVRGGARTPTKCPIWRVYKFDNSYGEADPRRNNIHRCLGSCLGKGKG